MASKRAETQIPFKKRPPDDPKQSARFVETAKATGANNGGLLARVLKKIVPKKRVSKSSKA
jgi:hypothetical protein